MPLKRVDEYASKLSLHQHFGFGVWFEMYHFARIDVIHGVKGLTISHKISSNQRDPRFKINQNANRRNHFYLLIYGLRSFFSINDKE